eukprot:TRINITY_DN931_c0_g1_i1.p1 TRINITY_DN931_c0_g1~~TRINITY_DN931_c0_g1_i1.p1  ORF type:complete len:203 (-),score=65.44 TRINITY_DN931_c0_g1_i1:93-701(-)
MSDDKKKDKKKDKKDDKKKSKKSPDINSLTDEEKAKIAEDQLKGWDSILKEKESQSQQPTEKREKPTLTRRISERFKLGAATGANDSARGRSATESSRLIAASGLSDDGNSNNHSTKGRPPSKSFDLSREESTGPKTDEQLIKEFLQRLEMEKYEKSLISSCADYDTFLSLTPDILTDMGVKKKHLKALSEAIEKERAKREK